MNWIKKQIVAISMWWESLWDDDDFGSGTPLSNTDVWTFTQTKSYSLGLGSI